ncbi:MAG TPA: helix-turn-helix domain-containing protein [Candidatus Dormibacteraeota bacterium]|nr:helix-turn-helix domain-containing protein [Candidatus Dormibacteraeota bacterium]
MTVAEAAGMLGIGINTAYEAVRRGELPAVRFGRRVVVPIAGLESVLRMDAEPTGTA